MGRQKAVIRTRRETKRVLRRDSRNHKRRKEESVTSLVQMSGVEAIGMARGSRDTSPIEACNEAQAHYPNAIDNRQLIFATGEAGCGKTWISAAKTAEAPIHKDVDRITVIRPVPQANGDPGFLSEDTAEEFVSYFRPVYDVLVRGLGAPFMQYCLRPEIGKVKIAPSAYIRGRTFKNVVVILDEAQNVTAAQMKMFLTRFGENMTVIVNGDTTQCDLPSGVRSGPSDTLARFEEDEMIGIVCFTTDDCVCSALCQRMLKAHYQPSYCKQGPGQPELCCFWASPRRRCVQPGYLAGTAWQPGGALPPTPGTSAVLQAKKKPVYAYELLLKYGGEGGLTRFVRRYSAHP